MPWRTLTTPRTRVAAATITLAVVMTGCGDQDAPEEQVASTASASPSPTAAESTAAESTAAESAAPSTSVKESPGNNGPAAGASASGPPDEAPAAVQAPSPGAGPRAMLLRAAEMPGLNAQHSWRPIATEHRERRRPVWACQVTGFVSIGATDVWVRRFVGRPGGGDSARARSAVITFVDDKSAQRAHAVLRAWHDRCEEQLRRFRRVRVDAAGTAVPVRSGKAEWRMAIYGPVAGEREASYFDATGYVREGKRISLTTMVSVGQDYNYPTGREPIVAAVRASAVKLRG